MANRSIGLACYGIDAGAGALQVMRAWRTWGRTRVESVYAGPDQSPDAEAVRRQMRDEQDDGRAVVALVFPARMTAHRRVVVPAPSSKIARRVLPARLDVELPFPLERSQHLFAHLRKSSEGWSAFAAAAQEEDLVRGCAAAPVDPWLLDAESLVAWDAALQDGLPRTGVAAVSVIGRGRWMTALGRDGILESVSAGRAPDDTASEAEWSAFTEDWSRRMYRAVETYGGGGTEGAWFWAGAALSDADRARRLQAALEGRSFRMRIVSEPAAWLASAAARRAAGSRDWPFNLREGALESPGLARWRSARLRRACAAAIAAGVAWAVASVAVTCALDARDRALQARVTSEAARIAEMDLRSMPRGFEVKKAEEQMDAREKAARPFRDPLRPPLRSTLAHILKTASEAGIRIEQIKADGTQWTLRGTALDERSARRLLNDLKAFQGDANIALDPPDAEGRVSFLLEARS